MNTPEDEGEALSISTLAESLKKHEAVLETLKDVPNLIRRLTENTDGVSQNERSSVQDEDELILNPDDLLKSSSEQDPEINAILEDVEKVVEFGPKLLPSIAEGFIKTVSRPLSKETKAKLKDKVSIPENCKEFSTPKVNPEIWRNLPQQAKLNDLKSQQNQQVLGTTLAIFASITSKLVEQKDQIPKETLSSIMQLAIDGSNIVGDQFQSWSNLRRNEMKRFLNPDFSGICNSKIPPGELLFGKDLAESLKASKSTSTIIRSTSSMHTSSSRFRPYFKPSSYSTHSNNNQHLNFRSPFQQQNRGNGHPRFRNSSQSSMLRPQFPQFNQRFKKQ